MLTTENLRSRLKASRRQLFSLLLCGAAISTASAEVVDLSTTPIDRSGTAIEYPIRQVQVQVPQPVPQPTPAPAIPAPFQAPTPAQQPIPAQQPPGLNVDPNADINDLIPQAPAPPAAPTSFGGNLPAGLGATAGAFSSAPNMIGDLFGGSFSTFGGSQTVPFSGYSAGTILSGLPGANNSIIAFEFGADTVPNDVFTSGLGSNNNLGNGIDPDGFDTFNIAEPLPPNDALTSPGAGFIFDGGTAVYTNNTTDTTPQAGVYQNGEQWYIAYSYTQSLGQGGGGEGGRPVPGPGTAARRVKISENFSPEVRDRCFASYSFFNDAFGGLGDISRYILGVERILVDELISIEARLPLAGTYASRQALDQAASRDFEFGNAAFIGKGVLLRTDRFIWSGGLGVTIPTADDTRISQGGQDVLAVKNETVHLLPFTAFLWRHGRDTAFQAYLQADVAVNGDPIFGNLAGGPLPQIGVFNDSTLLNVDVAMSHVLHRNNRGSLRQLIASGELHYTGTLQESDFVQSGSLTYTNLKRNFNVVNATGGLHFVLCNDLVVTPAMSIPLRSGLDEQFDYEAIVQVNYLR